MFHAPHIAHTTMAQLLSSCLLNLFAILWNKMKKSDVPFGLFWILPPAPNYILMRITKHSRIYCMFQLGLLLKQDSRKLKKHLMGWFKRFGLILTQDIPSLPKGRWRCNKFNPSYWGLICFDWTWFMAWING